MRTKIAMLLALAVAFFAPAALAWDGPALWFSPADAAQPGGGGILATGGARDYTISCAHCHIESKGMIDATAELNPKPATVGGQPVYEPGQTYQVTIKLVGEYLGLSGCQNTANNNEMAATIEDDSGNVAGVLRGDYGSSDNCPATVPNPLPGPTFTYGDCHGVLSAGADLTSWTFTWKAPPAGGGAATIFYGVVDGNCDMMSMGDDVSVGNMRLGEAMAARATPPSPQDRRFAWLGFLPVAGLMLSLRRRSRVDKPRASV